MNGIDAHDWLHIAVSAVSMVATIAVLRADVRWLRKWCDDHQRRDDRAFEQVAEDLRELRARRQ